MLISKRAMKALEGSIEKWRKIDEEGGMDAGTENCPLCELYFIIWNGCERCPIKMKTTKKECIGTPHPKWCDHQKKVHNISVKAGKVSDCSTCTRLARAELKFLRDLKDECEVK